MTTDTRRLIVGMCISGSGALIAASLTVANVGNVYGGYIIGLISTGAMMLYAQKK